jgi:hypothetical protein
MEQHGGETKKRDKRATVIAAPEPTEQIASSKLLGAAVIIPSLLVPRQMVALEF